MSEHPAFTPDEEADLMAAEFALDLLDRDQTTAAAAQARRDPAFAAAVRDWRQRLAPLAEAMDPIDPTPALKARIDRALFPDPAPARRPFGGRLRLWLVSAVAAIAAAVAVLLLDPQMTGAPPPDHIARLALPQARLTAEVSLAGGGMTVTLSEGSLPAGGDIEMWWIAPGGAPVSLGLAPRAGQSRRDLPAGLGPAEGVTIALSAEPAGGSPSGQPTGQVLATAPLTLL